jgi:hypothetical protein
MIRSWDSGEKTRVAAPLLIFLPFAKILHLVRIWACLKPFGIAKDCLGIRTVGYASRKLAHPLGHIPWCLTQVLHGSRLQAPGQLRNKIIGADSFRFNQDEVAEKARLCRFDNLDASLSAPDHRLEVFDRRLGNVLVRLSPKGCRGWSV